MAHVEKISISLTADMALAIRAAVESGEYASSSEVIREALRDWKVKKAGIMGYDAETIRKLWDEGIASGRDSSHSMEDIKREGRRRLKDSKS